MVFVFLNCSFSSSSQAKKRVYDLRNKSSYIGSYGSPNLTSVSPGLHYPVLPSTSYMIDRC